MRIVVPKLHNKTFLSGYGAIVGNEVAALKLELAFMPNVNNWIIYAATNAIGSALLKNSTEPLRHDRPHMNRILAPNLYKPAHSRLITITRPAAINFPIRFYTA